MFERLFSTYVWSEPDEKTIVKSMFDQYQSDLPANFYLDQFGLAKKYPGTDYAVWVKMLKHPAFNSWKQEQIAIIATTVTDKALAGETGDSVALNLLKTRQQVLEAGKSTERPTIIVLPESLYFREDSDAES